MTNTAEKRGKEEKKLKGQLPQSSFFRRIQESGGA